MLGGVAQYTQRQVQACDGLPNFRCYLQGETGTIWKKPVKFALCDRFAARWQDSHQAAVVELVEQRRMGAAAHKHDEAVLARVDELVNQKKIPADMAIPSGCTATNLSIAWVSVGV